MIGGLGGAAYGLSDEATAVVQGMPRDDREAARQSVRGFRRQNNDSFSQVQKAANALEQTATEAVGGNTAPRGVMRVQVVQPAFRLNDFLWSGSHERVRLHGPDRDGVASSRSSCCCRRRG